MNKRGVNAVLNRKYDEWRGSLPEVLRVWADENVIISGGCIASMLLGEKVNDFDFYLRDVTAAEVFAQHYVCQFALNPPPRMLGGEEKEIKVFRDEGRVKIKVRSAGVASEESDGGLYQYFETVNPEGVETDEYVDRIFRVNDKMEKKKKEKKEPFRPIFLTSNAITLSNQVQIIIRFTGTPSVIHRNFDYVHCTNYWTASDRSLTLNPMAIESLLNKQLVYNGSKYPLCSLFRIRKFLDRGWTINAGQILKAAFELGELDLHKPDVLEDQLIGVDRAYFTEVLKIIAEDKPDRIDAAYLMKVVDKVFC